MTQPAEIPVTEAPATPDPATPAEPAPVDPNAPATPPEPVKPPLAEELSTMAKAARAKLQEARAFRAAREALKTRESAAEATARENAELKATLDQATKKPIDWLKSRGVKPEHVLNDAVKAGTPEAKIAEFEARQAEFLAKQAEFEAARQKEAEEAKNRQAAELLARAEHAFLSMIQSKADKYEALTAIYTPDEVRAQAKEVARLAAQKGVTDVPDEEIADYLEQRAKPRYDALLKRAAEVRAKGSAAGGQGTAGAPRTLTNTMGTEKSSQAIDPSKLPKDEQDRYFAALYDRLAGKGDASP